MILQRIRIMVGDVEFDPRTVIFSLQINKLLKLLLLEVVIHQH